MTRNPVLDIPLSAVLRTEIALPLSQILNIHTVGNLLCAWRNPNNHKSIERLFDTSKDAENAVATCATWLGIQMKPQHTPITGWWKEDDSAGVNA
jgi:hypothetical protein